jgi:phosphatidylethanolamine/phosphatidyl-N-methylethanolamine N-methyltransferase
MWAGVFKQGQTGSLLPSQRFLIAKMIEPIPPDYRGHIVELGPGNGALTVRLAARCRRARVLACEINPVLARDTADLVSSAGLASQVDVVSEAAEKLLPELRKRGISRVDYVVSGIPLGHLERRRTLALIECIEQALAPGGLYVQFQYTLMDRKKIRLRFASLKTTPVLWNLPPAFVYYARKRQSGIA